MFLINPRRRMAREERSIRGEINTSSPCRPPFLPPSCTRPYPLPSLAPLSLYTLVTLRTRPHTRSNSCMPFFNWFPCCTCHSAPLRFLLPLSLSLSGHFRPPSPPPSPLSSFALYEYLYVPTCTHLLPLLMTLLNLKTYW